MILPSEKVGGEETLLYTLSFPSSEQSTGYKYKQALPNINIDSYKHLYAIVYYVLGNNVLTKDSVIMVRESRNATGNTYNVIKDIGVIGTDPYALRVATYSKSSNDGIVLTEIGIAAVNSSSPTNNYVAKIYGIN